MTETQLVESGLSSYEARAYLELLKHSSLTASSLSNHSGIPKGRIYEVLISLEKSGFCSVIPGNKKRYAAIRPKIAFAGLINQSKESLRQLEQSADELERAYEELQAPDQGPELVKILTSKQSQVAEFDRLINVANSTLHSFNKKPYATGFDRPREVIMKDSEVLVRCIGRGTKVRAIFEAESEENREKFLEMLAYYDSIGEEVRIADELPMKMLLADGSTAMVSMKDYNNSRFKLSSMTLNHSDLTNALEQLFNLRWENALTYSDYIKKLK